jgi:nitroreductase
MDLYEAIRRRRTVREFDDRPVDADKVERVLEAGLMAPSNGHQKFWEFILLKDLEERRTAVADALKARDLKDKVEIEKLVAGLSNEAVKEIYRRVLPVQLTMMLTAPEVLIVCYKMKPLSEAKTLFNLNALASAWMCIENIVLAMAAEGLYGCTYTPYDAEALKSHLGVPQGYEIAAVIPFGYPASIPPPNEKEPLEGRLHIDHW